jgi:hypothetical protein
MEPGSAKPWEGVPRCRETTCLYPGLGEIPPFIYVEEVDVKLRFCNNELPRLLRGLKKNENGV